MNIQQQHEQAKLKYIELIAKRIRLNEVICSEFVTDKTAVKERMDELDAEICKISSVMSQLEAQLQLVGEMNEQQPR